MSGTIRSFVWCFGLAVCATTCGTGCSHLIETNAITAFSKSLKDKDLEGLMKTTTDDFQQRALRTTTALEDMRILNLPDGKTTIVEVENESDEKKRVTVLFTAETDGKKDKKSKDSKANKKEVFYELARDKSGHWAVDDIYLKQKRKGVVAYKSVTEQMDLLLSVREFIDTWSHGDREHVLRITSKSFREVLDPLPPSFLANLTRMVAAGKASKGKFKPHAELDEKTAVVRLPRVSGHTVISLELFDHHWQVTDVSIDCKGDEQLPSMLKLAQAVNGCTSFLAAFGAGDKQELAGWSTTDFYEGSLAIGELHQVKLPDPMLTEHDLQVKVRGNRADFILKNDTELVQIDMHRTPEVNPNAKPRFLVSEVTIYEIATKQEKRLSALFTAQGMLEIFVQALANRDVVTLKHASTRDLAARVWSKLNKDTITAMPLQPFDNGEVEFVDTVFQGALTKVDVRQGGRQLTYLLREERGRFFVDDVQWQITGIPSSLKTTLEILVPIHEFASAIAQGQSPDEQSAALERLQANSTSDFNRAVWTQAKFVPNSGMSADTFLLAPLKGIALGDQEVTVQLGDSRFGAKVILKREFERFVVDDIQLIAGPEESQRLALKNALRSQLARGEARRPQNVVPAGFVRETPAKLDTEGNADPFANELLR